MRATFDLRLTLLWAVLVAVTGLSFLLGTDHTSAHRGLSAAVVVLALFKFRLVGLHFMELRRAPALLRGIFEGYVLIVGLTILGLLFMAR